MTRENRVAYLYLFRRDGERAMASSLEKELDLSKKSIVICIPAYNEEKSIAKLIIDLKKYSNKIIVVDDGSSDYTAKIAKELGAKVIQHDRNRGKGAALNTCFTNAMSYSPDVIITIDGDGQHDPIYIPELIKPIINNQADIVIGSRSNATKMPRHRKMGLKAINYLNRKAVGTTIKDAQSGYRAYSYRSAELLSRLRFDDYSAEFEQLETLLSEGFTVVETPIEIKYTGLGKTSKKNFLTHGGELILASLFMMISRRPIMYLALPGALLLFVGLFYAFYTLFLFNVDRYFSIPMSVISGGLLIIGSLLVMSSMFIYILAKMQTASQNR